MTLAYDLEILFPLMKRFLLFSAADADSILHPWLSFFLSFKAFH